MSFTRGSGSLRAFTGGATLRPFTLGGIGDIVEAVGGGITLFNVEDPLYGAVGDGATDDYTAIKAAWDAMCTYILAGHDALLYFPRAAVYRCVVDGKLSVGAAEQYAVFQFPKVTNNTSTPMRIVGVAGTGKALVGRQFGNGSDVAGSRSASVLKIEYTGSFAYSGTHGIPSVFGGPDPQFAAHGTSNAHAYVEHMHVRQPSNPSMLVWNFAGLQCATVDDIFCDTTDFPDEAVLPTNPTGGTLLWPAAGNAAVLTCGAAGAWGMFAGVPTGEHLLFEYAWSVRCRIGHPVYQGSDHFNHWLMTVSEECQYVIAGWDPSDDIGVIAVPSPATVWKIGCLDFEDFPATVSGVDAGFYTRTDGAHVYDPNNQLRGIIYIAGINSGATSPTGRTDNITAKGGTSAKFISLINGADITLTQNGHDPAGGGGGDATVPGAPTIGTAVAGNASASVAFTAPASDGGAAITGYTATSSPGTHTGSGSTSPITVSGLTNGVAYTFTVHATNSVGNSAESSASNSVTPASGGNVSIFTTQTPSNSGGTGDNNDSAAYTLGVLFVPASTLSCVGARWFYPTSVPSQNVVFALWHWDSDITGTLLATKTFTGSPTAGDWNAVTWDTPVSLTSGVKYVVSAWTKDHYPFAAHSSVFPITHGGATIPDDDSGTPVRNGRIHVGASSAFPEQAGGCFFVDPIFSS